jgi:hypothetical protein
LKEQKDGAEKAKPEESVLMEKMELMGSLA